MGGRAAAALVVALLGPACVSPRGHHDPTQPPTSAPPGSVALGAPCGSFVDCAPAAGKSVGCRCTDHAAVPLCVTDAEAGEPCGGSAPVPCRPGLVCTQASTDAGFACASLGAAGDRCDLGGCADDLYCDGTGHCAIPAAAAGAPCLAADPWSCVAPAVCALATSMCVPPIADGAPCNRTLAGRSECGRGSFCTLARGDRDGLCQPRQPDGADCLVDEECLSWVCYGAFCGAGFPASVAASCSL
jgi:hypothetical protein